MTAPATVGAGGGCWTHVSAALLLTLASSVTLLFPLSLFAQDASDASDATEGAPEDGPRKNGEVPAAGTRDAVPPNSETSEGGATAKPNDSEALEEEPAEAKDGAAEADLEAAEVRVGGDEPAGDEALMGVDDASSDEAFQLRTLNVVDEAIDVSRIAGSAHEIDAQSLEEQKEDNIDRLLVQVPGVYVRTEDGFGLRPNIGLRGANSNRSSKVTLMEDGVLFGPAPYSAPAAYYFPLTMRLTGIEVYKGPAGIRFGPNTVGGAINLRTRAIPSASEGAVDVSAGMFRSGKVHGHWGMSGKQWGVLIEGARLQTRGFKNIDGADDLQNDDTGFARNEFMLKARVNSKPSAQVYHSLELKLGYSDERSHETYLGLTEDDFRADPYRRYAASQHARMDWWRTQAQLRHQVSVHENLEFQTTVYRHDLSRAWRKLNRFRDGDSLENIMRAPNSGNRATLFPILTGERDSQTPGEDLMIGTNDRQYVSQGIHAEGAWRHEHNWFRQELRFGARYHYDQIERNHTENAYLMRNGTLVRRSPSGSEEDLVTADNRGKAHAVALHIEDEISLGEHWVLVPGFRLEMIHTSYQDDLRPLGEQQQDSRFDAVWIPGGGVVYRPWTAVSFLAGVHKGFSPVSPGQNADIQPERSVNYEAGLRWHPEAWKGHTVRAESIGFFNDYRNLTVECGVAQGCTEEEIANGAQSNGGKVWVWGAELLIDHLYAVTDALGLGAALSYTYTGSSFRETFVSTNPFLGNVERGDELAYVPEHQGAITLRMQHTKGYVRLVTSLVGRMRDEAGSGPLPRDEGSDRAAIVDLSGGYLPTAFDTLYLNIDNLFNKAYVASRRPFGARPGMPFRLMAGYKRSF